MSNSRRKYTKEFKLKVVKEHLEGSTLTELSKIYGIAPSTIGTWFATLKSEVEAGLEEEEVPTETFVEVGEVEKFKEYVEILEKKLDEKEAEIESLKDQVEILPEDSRKLYKQLEEKDALINELEASVLELHQTILDIKEEASRELRILKEAIRILAQDKK